MVAATVGIYFLAATFVVLQLLLFFLPYNILLRSVRPTICDRAWTLICEEEAWPSLSYHSQHCASH